MSRSITSFADLLAPFSPAESFKRYWENEPLHVRRAQPRFYEALLTAKDVEAVISSGGLRYPAVQLAKNGGFFPAEAFTRNLRSGGDVFAGVPDLDRVRAEYASGATISLPGFQRAWRPFAALAAAIEDEFDHPAHANVYLTPGNAIGFHPHYDTHEVFVLQIAGNKRWQVFESPLPLPHRSQPFDPRRYKPTEPLLEIDIAPGDLLYLPRGFVHTTVTGDSFSLHVTLGVTVYTWVELLLDWVQSSKNYKNLRRALPPGFATRDDVRRSLADHLGPIIAGLQTKTDDADTIDRFAKRVPLPARQGAANFASMSAQEHLSGRVQATNSSGFSIFFALLPNPAGRVRSVATMPQGRHRPVSCLAVRGPLLSVDKQQAGLDALARVEVGEAGGRNARRRCTRVQRRGPGRPRLPPFGCAGAGATRMGPARQRRLALCRRAVQPSQRWRLERPAR